MRLLFHSQNKVVEFLYGGFKETKMHKFGQKYETNGGLGVKQKVAKLNKI